MHIVSKEEMYAIDQFAINKIGLPSELLMENAGRSIYQAIQGRLTKKDRIGVVIGKGNNGGDGFVVARYLHQGGYSVDVWLIPEQGELRGAALTHQNIFLNSGGMIHRGLEEFKTALPNYSIVIDALLGIGSEGEVRTPYLDFIRAINSSRAEVIAIDIPSGVPANGGYFSHESIRACRTLTIHRPKMGQFTFPSHDYYGAIEVLDIGIPDALHDELRIGKKLWRLQDIIKNLPRQRRNAHKGSNGKGLLIAGSESLPGAASLSCFAAIRSGIGLLSLNAPKAIHPMIMSRVPEVMFETSETSADYAMKYDAIAIGPGLGRKEETRDKVMALLQVNKPLIIDADGLYHLGGQLDCLQSRTFPTILTPHSGEMARLLGCPVQEIEQDRFQQSKDFAITYGVYLVLKGPYTIVTTPTGEQFVNSTGNPALAKGGSGDVLTGMILAFILQHKNVQEAISNAVYVHGAVADELVKRDHAMMTVRASDIVDGIPNVIHALFQESES